MADKSEDILYQAHNEGIWEEVMKVSKTLKGSYYTYGDKLEQAYNIVKKKQHEKNNSKK
tara:strand:+ start:277 stop:453 length:177 start_codon:yes stop_codon:yes gene_type:complete